MKLETTMTTSIETQLYDEQRLFLGNFSNGQMDRCCEDEKFLRTPERCLQQLAKVLTNWRTVDVRTVPGVMYQVRCGHDQFDPSIEYQFNWFVDCTETLIHNHRHTFDSFCLEGEYEEKLWRIDHDDEQKLYRFRRNADTTFTLSDVISGTLRHVTSRFHFPGNQLHVDTHLFHSITPKVGSTGRVLTFLIKHNHCPPPDTFALSHSPDLDMQENEMRPATDTERQNFRDKLQQLYALQHN